MTVEEHRIVRKSVVGVAGLGGVGGLLAERMARLGVERLKIGDPEVFEPSNINRQFGASTATLGKNKAGVVSELLHDIHPHARIEAYTDGITPRNVGAFVEGANIILMAIDRDRFDTMVLLAEEARKKNVWLISSGVHHFGASLLVFPPWGMPLDTFFRSVFPKIARGVPENLSAIGPSCSLAAALAAAEAVIRLTHRRESIEIPRYVFLDLLKPVCEIIDPLAIDDKVAELTRHFIESSDRP